MFFIRLFLANTWEKNRGSPCLFPHKLLWEVDMVLRSQLGWIICAAGTEARYKITPIVFYALEIKLVFGCFYVFDIANTENLKRVFGNTHFSFIFLFFDSKPASCQPICGIIIANKSFSSAKETLVCSFRPSGKNRRHLGCGNVMHSRGCAVQNKGITLKLSVVQDIKTLLIF